MLTTGPVELGLRAMKLAVGGKAAATEAQRMFGEKIEASLALQGRALSGGLGATELSAAAETLDHYRQKVRTTRHVMPKVPLDGHIDVNEDANEVVRCGRPQRNIALAI